MYNYKLLLKHRKRLSIFFALFILLSIWLVEGIFVFSTYLSNNSKIEEKLEVKNIGVINILENKEFYFSKISTEDKTTKLIIEKSLEGVTIIENGKTILGNINPVLFGTSSYLNSKTHKYYKYNLDINGNNYIIITQLDSKYNYYNFILEYLNFILFTLPFSIFFYYIGYIFVGRNIKPIKDTIKSLENFSENVNHELKTPLTEIISTLSLAQKIKGNYEEAIEQSLKSSKKINKILNSMLSIINLVNLGYKKEKINLIVELENLIQENKTYLKQKNITINKNFLQNKYNLYINKEHFEICVGNILKNAIKYSNKNSKINIKFDNGEIEIQDFGIGIEEKNLKNIFSRYFRENYTKEEGHGLGLALVKKIIETNGWEIKIKSEKNKTTIVKINFNS